MFLVRSIGFSTVVIYSFLIICCAVVSNTLPFETSPNLGQPSTVNVDPLFNLERTNSSRLWQWVDATPPSMRSSQKQLISTGLHRRNFKRNFKEILYSAIKQNRHRKPKNTPGDSNSTKHFKSHPRSAKHKRPHRSVITSTAYYLETSQKGNKNGERNDREINSLENTMDGYKYNTNNDRRNGKQDIFRDLFGHPGTFYIRRGEQSRVPSTNTRQVPGAQITSTTTTVNSSTLNYGSNSDVNYTANYHKASPLRTDTTPISLQHTDVTPVSKLSTIISIFNERKHGKKKRYKHHQHKHHHRRRRRRGRRQVSKRKPRRLYGSSLDYWVNAADRRHRIHNTTSNVNNKTRIGRLKIRNQLGFNGTLKSSDIYHRNYDTSNNETFNALWSQVNSTRYTVTSNLISNRSEQLHEQKQQEHQQPQLQFQQNNSIIGNTRHTSEVLPAGGESKWLIHTLNAVESDKNVNNYNTDLRNDRINDFTKVDMLPNYLSPKVDTHSESIFSVSRFNSSSLYPSRAPSLLSLIFPRTATLKQYSAPPSFLQLSNQSNSPTSLLSSLSSSSASLLASSLSSSPSSSSSSSSFFPLYPGHHISVVPESDATDLGGDHPQKVLIPHTSRKMPQALIIGVKKGGTRAVLEFLRLHPDVRAPGPEPHFFDRHYHNGLEWYRSLMPRSEEGQLTIEKTPSYFITKEVPRRVYQFSKHLKLIVVVRDPVTRAISDYTQVASKKMDSRSFEEMVFVDNTSRIVDTQWSPVRIGVYAKHLKHWLQYFPLEQMHFVSGERLIENPADEMLKVQQFLGLRPVINHKHFYLKSRKGFPCILKPNRQKGSHPHCLGETKGRIHPMIDPSVIRRLRDFYKPFNIKFYRMVNQDFGWV